MPVALRYAARSDVGLGRYTSNQDSGYAGPHRLAEALREANDEISRRAADDPQLAGMGTTATVLMRYDRKLALAHIGDSRGYLFRDGQLTRITRDHTFVQSLVDEGRISADEAEQHPQRNIVTRV